jgi:hypothetical protein
MQDTVPGNQMRSTLGTISVCPSSVYNTHKTCMTVLQSGYILLSDSIFRWFKSKMHGVIALPKQVRPLLLRGYNTSLLISDQHSPLQWSWLDERDG